MARATGTILLSFLFIFNTIISSSLASFNVMSYGAKPDGQTDSSKAFLAAWAAACAARRTASIAVPKGSFLVSNAQFAGPCNNTAIQFVITGTIVAPSGYTSAGLWLQFKYVEGVSVIGGTIDGRGQAYWDCKKAGKSCPQGAASLGIYESKNFLVSGLRSLNSEQFHIVLFGSSGVRVQRTKIMAPQNSPNTDGIHIQKSTGVTIVTSTFKTGDDCISIGEGATNVWIEGVTCGPGHGISIGSLGGTPQEAGVQNITVTNAVFTDTQNGIRIKTWGKPNSGYVKGVKFQHIIMRNVQNPIMVNQNYCPGTINCPDQSSGVKISQVSYTDVQGSSATPVAMMFDCSPSNPCDGIALQDIKLTYGNKPAQSYCKHANGYTSGFVFPPSCL